MAAASTSNAAGRNVCKPGRRITSTPNSPDTDCPNPALCGHALAQHRVSQQQSPNRGGEFERKHGGQREYGGDPMF